LLKFNVRTINYPLGKVFKKKSKYLCDSLLQTICYIKLINLNKIIVNVTFRWKMNVKFYCYHKKEQWISSYYLAMYYLPITCWWKNNDVNSTVNQIKSIESFFFKTLLDLTDVCPLLTKQYLQVGLQIQYMLYNFQMISLHKWYVKSYDHPTYGLQH
jgi:hypothetical protein